MRLGNRLCEIVQDGAALDRGRRQAGRSAGVHLGGSRRRSTTKLVGQKTRGGLAGHRRGTVDFTATAEPREPTLEAAITADPYDTSACARCTARLVRPRHHPRGELIALQLAEEARGDDALKAATLKHLARYKAELPASGARAVLCRQGLAVWLALWFHPSARARRRPGSPPPLIRSRHLPSSGVACSRGCASTIRATSPRRSCSSAQTSWRLAIVRSQVVILRRCSLNKPQPPLSRSRCRCPRALSPARETRITQSACTRAWSDEAWSISRAIAAPI